MVFRRLYSRLGATMGFGKGVTMLWNRALGKVNGLCYLKFIHSSLSVTPLLRQASNCSPTFLELHCNFEKTIWIVPRLSAVSWDRNKVLLSAQAQSLFKSSLLSLLHFLYSYAIWQKDAFSPFYMFLQLNLPHSSCGRVSGFVRICPRNFQLLLQKRRAEGFELSRSSLHLLFNSFKTLSRGTGFGKLF